MAENKIIAARGIQAWENMVKAVKFWMELPKQKQPNKDNKSFKRLKSAINNPLIPLKLKVFAKIVEKQNTFLVL